MSFLPINPNLELILANNNGGLFYVHEMTLDEGLCRLSRGEVLLYSYTHINHKELNGYLGINATVKITRRNHEQVVSRAFSGIVTQVEHLGVMQESAGQVVYGFKMVIEPLLANLRYACHQFNYEDKSPQEAITAILNQHDIAFELHFSEDEITEWNVPRSFFQDGENDYDFFIKILADYGIGFNYESNPSSTLSILHLFAGVPYQSSSLLEGAQSNALIDFHCRQRGEDAHAMTSWEMDSCLGTDCVSIDYQTAGGESLHKVAGKQDSCRAMAFNHSPFGQLSSDSIERIANNYLQELQLNQQDWRGETASIEAMPGTAINVLEFYGSHQQETIEALIISSRLFCRAPMPDSLLNSAQTQNASCSVKIGCVNRKRKTPYMTQMPILQENHCGLPSVNPYIQAHTEDDVVFAQAVVCDKNGEIKNNTTISLDQDSSGNNTYYFMARLNTEKQRPVRVWFVMPLGGQGQGVFKNPRQGEHILVAKVSHSEDYYLLGYIPNGKMPYVDSLDATRAFGGSTPNTRSLKSAMEFRFTPDSDNGVGTQKLITGKDNTIALDEYVKPGDKPAFSGIAFYSVNPKKSTAGVEKSKSDVVFTATQDIALDAPELFEGTAKKVSFSGQLGDSKGDLIIKSRNISFSADEAISLCAGQTKVTIGPDSVNMAACRWANVSGPLTSMLNLTAMSGIMISGAKTKVNGAFSFSLGDGAGANISASAGLLSGTGASIDLKTSNTFNLGVAVALTGSQLATEIAGYIVAATASENALKNYEKAMGWVNLSLSGVATVVKACNFKNNVNALHKDTHPRLNKLVKVINVLETIIDRVQRGLEITNGKWMSSSINGSSVMTNRDAFHLTSLSLMLTSWTATLIITLKDLAQTTSSLTLQSDKIFLETPDAKVVSVKRTEDNVLVRANDFSHSEKLIEQVIDV